MQVSRRVADDEMMHSVLEMWLCMKVQTFLYEQGLMLPLEVDLTHVWTMLDVACGSGQWVRDMATWSPDMTIVGVDRQLEMIEQARYLSDIWRPGNTSFLVGNMYHMTEIEDESFDLVHARFLAPAVAPQAWPFLLHECMRVCRVGGRFVWTEASFPTTNSAACQQWWSWMKQAMTRLGNTPDVTPFMARLFSDVNSENSERMHQIEKVLDMSANAPLHERMYRHIPALLLHTKPFLLKYDVADEQAIDALCQQMVLDLYSDTFEATWTLI
ncbi:MAG TPA: class I SAM-dependent methyltransferase, partial [Ktedonobacteraceae bacterium]|nr:class I SAM-dependent methyltransferase [Ktedonobacteraceae bacterium]